MAGVESVQIFISYAWDDNDAPPDFAANKGFVEYLQDCLRKKFKGAGPFRPALWRDGDNIPDGEPFPERLKIELDRSALLFIVFSPNWLSSEHCREELSYFKSSCQRRGLPFDKRVILIEKLPVDLSERPSELQNRVGYKFYNLTSRPVRPLEEFFGNSGPTSQFWSVSDDLFVFVSDSAKRTIDDKPTATLTNGRTVYVARAATDMFEEYIRLVAELTNKGYNVVPKREDNLPNDSSAQSAIDAELAAAEASIHLVGESAGWKPEGLDEIVKLQLDRAAARGASAAADQPFRRIIWAPKTFVRDPRAGGETISRDSFDVLHRFGTECPNDKVLGDDFASFRETLVSHLDRVRQKAPAPADEAVGVPGQHRGRLFVLHDENDREFARRLRKALSEHDVEAILPVRDDDEIKRNALNDDVMRSCDGVVICWGSATETWTRAQARRFDSWRELGRQRIWEPRGVVLGPPPGTYKAEFQEDGPPSEIDAIVVVDDLQAIPPDELRKLIPRRVTSQS
jgi:hypothetical protein